MLYPIELRGHLFELYHPNHLCDGTYNFTWFRRLKPIGEDTTMRRCSLVPGPAVLVLILICSLSSPEAKNSAYSITDLQTRIKIANKTEHYRQ